MGNRYKQHNPLVADGPEGLKAFCEFLKANFPEAHSEIKQVFADGDYVILHVHSTRTPGTRGRAIIEIFRLENGKIDEHWNIRVRGAGQLSKYSSSKTGRLTSTGTQSRRSRKHLPIRTGCSDTQGDKSLALFLTSLFLGSWWPHV